MNPKLGILITLLLAITTKVAAVDLDDKEAHVLAIIFFALCVVVLLVVLVISVILYRRKKQGPGSGHHSKYNMTTTEKQKTFSGEVGVYGNYTDPAPSGSIYLPLDHEKKGEEGNGYAHLEGGRVVNQEGNHTYETLKDGNTFKKTDNEYDNPGMVLNGETNGDSGSEHDYEMADVTVRQGPAYENPVRDTNTSF